MRILIVNRALGILVGGGESFDLGLARQLVARGHRVTLVTGKPPFHQAPNQFPFMETVYVPIPNLRKYAYATEMLNTKISAAFYHLDNWLFERAVYRWFKHHGAGRKFDVVQCCSLFRLPQWLLKSSRQAVVAWLPGPPSGQARRAISRLVRDPRFGLFAHGTPVWTLEGEMGLRRGLDFQIIEPGVDLCRVEAAVGCRMVRRHEIGLKEHDLVGMTTARLVPVKNLDLLLKGIAEAKARGVRWHWLIAGDGPERPRLERLVGQLGLQRYVRFLGHLELDTVHQWLEAADLFALTSRYESFSIASIEAMAHGLPVIGTDVGYLRHMIHDARAGVTVPLDDPGAMAEALVRMSSREERLKFRNAGRVFAQGRAWPAIAEKVERLYERVVGEAGDAIHA